MFKSHIVKEDVCECGKVCQVSHKDRRPKINNVCNILDGLCLRILAMIKDLADCSKICAQFAE